MTHIEVAKWYEEQERIFNENKENEHMALTEFEETIKAREQERSELLQELSYIEGTLDGNSKVTQEQFFSLMRVVRRVIQNGK